ncbi:Zn-dependent protease with chaperone function [Murinocardiopsis flavida]|uniref:Zn-dependent protease with chaperone function n=1 Tax=Murinocardiopsis flavida TaxID=645275 RepID=A0A2P8DTP9_9ACTN|nr:M56 family metallopeptidase [Murinocardiopsis flavida]PSL00583.1 Zn-dependent protease with chaperone function [Murinocardiopsis flavida]
MTPLLALGAALLLSTCGPALLRALGRAGAAPRTLLVLWVLATAAWLVTWCALLLMLVTRLLGPGVKGIIAACVTLLQAAHRNGAEFAVSALLAAGAAVLFRLGWVALRQRRETARWRRRHRRDLDACATPRTLHRRRVWFVDTGAPGVYCVPGGGRGIVVTRGAVEALSAREMRAVLAHELAHLRGRHHLLVAWTRLLDDAFPGVPLLRAAAREVPVLVEWAADDRAVRAVGRGPLVHALGAMAGTRAESGAAALAISGSCAVQRVRRLVAPSSAPARGSALAVLAGAALVLPPLLTAAATLAGVVLSHCACAA